MRIDLRSDTVTLPTFEMRQYMASAPVGDDVFSEDPTINELQQRICLLTGKKAALFVPSGTMSNQIAIKAHTQPGDEVICEYGCHIFNFEGGAPAMLSGAQLHPLRGERGVITADQVKPVIRSSDHHNPRTALIEIENTHNRAGGAIFPFEPIMGLRRLADEHSLRMHLDGARLWNAHIATGIAIVDWCRPFDSISLCFSKGLGAPVGSILCGESEFIERAHRYRKMVGGGMRQAGILAAAALYAVDHHLQRLEKDHRRARELGEFLVNLGLGVDLAATQTNIVIADLAPLEAGKFCRQLADADVLALPISATRVRFVTHLDVGDEELEHAKLVIKKVIFGK